ncbi:hypothetical protein P7C70_g6435, partial [Phenoliferia sp. Uapishka_3]
MHEALDDMLAQMGLHVPIRRQIPVRHAWCPPPPRSGASPISSLAPELLRQILSLVIEDPPASAIIPSSLVCRAWRDPAQALLWREIALMGGDEPYLDQMRASAACGRWKTENVIAVGTNGRKVGRLLKGLRGVQRLTLYEHEGLDPKMFAEVKAFEDLKELTLNLAGFTHLASQIALPFKLEFLSITGDYSPALVSSILASSPNLSTLILQTDFGAACPAFTTFLPLILPTLQHLTLSETHPDYLSLVLQHCASLKSLHLDSSFPVSEFPALLKGIPAALSKIKIGVNVDEEGIDRLTADLKLKMVTGGFGNGVLREVETLEIVFEGSIGEWDLLKGAGEVERRCARAGVELLFDREICDEEDEEEEDTDGYGDEDDSE